MKTTPTNPEAKKSSGFVWNVPNVISGYRLLSFPFLLYLIFTKQEDLFAILLCINLFSDVVDGIIARVFKLQTEFGARLDSLADYGTYILAFGGIYQFKRTDLAEDLWMLWAFIGVILLYNLVSWLKFKQFPSLHMYSTKVGGYVQGFFFFGLFAFGYTPWSYKLAMCWGYASAAEEIAVLLILPQLQSNVKGLYWVLKNR